LQTDGLLFNNPAMKEVVCGVILDRNGKVLACRRAADRHLGGLWEFPGGKVEDGESPEKALARELLEELGISVEVGGKMDPVVEWTDGDVSIRLTAFWCGIIEGQPVALEHEEIRWCETEELSALDWAEADVPVVAEISNFKSQFPRKSP
jgi:8-oxo-dGTP diphosphatase